MHHKHLFFAILISTLHTYVQSMETSYQSASHYNLSCIHTWAPEDIWIQIIACSDEKGILRQTCSYFRECASTRNEKIFLQRPLVIVPEVLNRFALYYADFANNQILNNLLYHGANPNNVDDNNNSLMHYAAQNGNLEIVKTLLEHPEFDKKNIAKNEYSPLLLAAHYKHTKIVEHILSQCTIDYNTMLCLSIHYGLSDLTQLLLTHMSCENIVINTKNIRPPSTRSICPFETRCGKKDKMSALHYATIKRDTHTAQLLISHGIPVDTADNKNCTPLHYAIEHNATNMITLLMNNKATMDKVCETSTSLCHAVLSNLMTKMLFLLNHGADINAKDECGTTVLHIASARGYTQAVKLLLAYNADINERNNDGRTALHVAYLHWQHTIMRLLFSHPDIDIELSGSYAGRPLLSCIIRDYRDGYKDMIDLLIEKTDINAMDGFGNNPLSYTYWDNNMIIMQKLVKHPKIQINALFGQNLSDEFEENRRDNFGYKRSGPVTILDLAMRPDRKEIIDLLKQHGAKTRAELEKDGLL